MGPGNRMFQTTVLFEEVEDDDKGISKLYSSTLTRAPAHTGEKRQMDHGCLWGQ